MIRVKSTLLNEKIRGICDRGDEFEVKGLEGTGKAIPYIGWYWRDVDFNDEIILGYCPPVMTFLEQNPGFVGFMENNKWGYDQWTITEEQADRLKGLLLVAVAYPTQEKLQAVFDYMQTLRKEFVECPVCNGMGEACGEVCRRCRGFGKVPKEVANG